MDIVHKMLIKSGNWTEDVLSNLEWWDKIEYLRDIANEAAKKKYKTKEDL